MFKLIFILIIFISCAYADKKVELFASSVDANGSIITANNDVVVLYDGLYLSANSATYNKDSGVIEFFGDVSALKGAQFYAMGDYLMVNTKDEIKIFRPFFFQDRSDKLWISAKSAKSKKEKYDVRSGMVSSCNPQDPDWTIRFSTGYYDDENQWMQLYNARLYAGEIPLFYFPYFAYPTDTTRRSGLLRPMFGFSADEGLFYQQPIYIAEDPRWDLEILPQIRTMRGKGLYTTLRFADSPNSFGSFVVGGFKEKDSYLQEFKLKNQKHYGAEFDYQGLNVINRWLDLNLQGSSAIFADLTYLNDIEYTNLRKTDSLKYATTSQVTSRLNLFLNQSENYYGLYSKYFIDLNKKTNSDTLQYLPILQYHNYLDTFFNDHLLYSVDYRGTNFYRETRKNAMQNELTIPLDLQFSLLDEYLTLTVSENLYASQISFYGSDNPNDPNDPTNPNIQQPTHGYRPGIYSREYQTVELNTNLVKNFDDFTHTIAFTVAYTHPGQSNKNGFYKDYEAEFKDIRANNVVCGGGPCEYDTITNILEQASLEFTQYVFTQETGTKLYQRLKQPIVYESGYDKYGDLENELRYNFTKDLSYYNNTFYNYDRNVITKTQNTIGYNGNAFRFNLSHLYTDKLVENVTTHVQTRTQTSYLNANATYKYSTKWRYFAGYAYDIAKSKTKNRNIGFLFNKRCWSLELKYVENIRPTRKIINGSSVSSSIKDRVVYLTLNLRPIGGMQVNYKSSGNQ